MPIIPVSEPLILKKEFWYINEALRMGWISSEGKFVNRFEEGFAKYVGKRYGIAVNNGTNALILALRTLDLPKGSEVIIPSFTIISCALACVYNNLIPVFVDSEEDTWNMDTSGVETKVTKKTKAIMAVHIYGHPVDMGKIIKIARRYNLYLIEDFAEAIGSEYKGKKCGGFGDISCVSFYANKTLTTGEGGMCLTDRADFAKKLKRLRNLAFIPQKRFLHYELGFNFRISNVQAAIGLAQLERIKKHIKKKIWIARKYTGFLKELENKELLKLPVEKEWAKNTYWAYGIVLNKNLGLKAEEISKKLLARGIDTRSFFYPLHLQPVFKEFSWYKHERLLVSENLHKYGLYLPSGLTLKREVIKNIANVLKEIISRGLL